MALDSSTPRSRRAILVGALGGVAASALAAVARPGRVAAAGGDDGSQIDVGSQFYDCRTQTILGNQVDDTTVFSAFSSTASGHGGGTGIYGSSGHGVGVRAHSDVSNALFADSPAGTAIYATSTSGVAVMGVTQTGLAAVVGSAFGDSTGVSGESVSGTGVVGLSGTGFPPAPAPNVGVFGYCATDATSRGVMGKTTGGQAVRGEATTGIGVRGYATQPTGIAGLFTAAGVALKVEGRATFTRSGRVNVPANASSVDIAVAGGIAATAFVVATLQTHVAGVAIEGVRLNYPSTGKARIYLSKVASTTTTTPVGWLAIG